MKTAMQVHLDPQPSLDSSLPGSSHLQTFDASEAPRLQQEFQAFLQPQPQILAQLPLFSGRQCFPGIHNSRAKKVKQRLTLEQLRGLEAEFLRSKDWDTARIS